MKISAFILSSLFFISSVANGGKIGSEPHRAKDYNLDNIEEALEVMEETVDKLLEQTTKHDVKERQYGSQICLNTITAIMNAALFPVEVFFDTLDPIALGNKIEYTLLSSQLPGGCNTGATILLDPGTLRGLSTTELDLEVLPGGTCNIFYSTFKATWMLSKTTNLNVISSAELNGDACGMSAGTKATGTVGIPDVTLSATVTIDGNMDLSSRQANLNQISLDDFNFEIPSVDLSFLAESPLGGFELSQSYEELITNALTNTVSDAIEDAFNGLINDRLPISIP